METLVKKERFLEILKEKLGVKELILISDSDTTTGMVNLEIRGEVDGLFFNFTYDNTDFDNVRM